MKGRGVRVGKAREYLREIEKRDEGIERKGRKRNCDKQESLLDLSGHNGINFRDLLFNVRCEK